MGRPLVVEVNDLACVDPMVSVSIPPVHPWVSRYTNELTVTCRQSAAVLVAFGVVFIGSPGSVRHGGLSQGTRSRFGSLNQPYGVPSSEY